MVVYKKYEIIPNKYDLDIYVNERLVFVSRINMKISHSYLASNKIFNLKFIGDELNNKKHGEWLGYKKDEFENKWHPIPVVIEHYENGDIKRKTIFLNELFNSKKIYLLHYLPSDSMFEKDIEILTSRMEILQDKNKIKKILLYDPQNNLICEKLFNSKSQPIKLYVASYYKKNKKRRTFFTQNILDSDFYTPIDFFKHNSKITVFLNLI